ncbi:hypothetical protein C5B42_04850 [Candidatus Cerribacteria bacterium 'Amazon FNV 2010 28 9']|uniref:Prepilin peptidase n=1 Tax=Candidatus Cerribacteria bacterium 'Amazon FNV 2010 28 9' TaxID=2081795 RepID=A0A317JRW0_9BACT|nr:MAG: hypothetical protein C5B42_04850 [Candidatus Cerribacteria bacterium 'Amazon FNV 2010 28 9']
MIVYLLLILVLLFFLGMAIGSFLNVIIYRMVNGDSALRGRSYCDNCKQKIAWYDNIPVLSFILLHRKCRYCGMPIPWEYPAVEFLTGSLFVWWYLMGFTFFHLTSRPFLIVQPVFWLCIGIILLVIFFADFSYAIIPDSAVFIMGLLSLTYHFFLTSHHVMMQSDFALTLITAGGAGLFFFLLHVLTKGKGMGLGDVKYSIAMGLLLGWPDTLVGLFVAFILGSIVGIIAILLSKKKLGSRIPFGPFLVLGTIIALLWGSQLVTMYLRLL